MNHKRLGDYHIFLDFWLTPWTWTRPSFKRYDYGQFEICFGFGKLDMMCD